MASAAKPSASAPQPRHGTGGVRISSAAPRQAHAGDRTGDVSGGAQGRRADGGGFSGVAPFDDGLDVDTSTPRQGVEPPSPTQAHQHHRAGSPGYESDASSRSIESGGSRQRARLDDSANGAADGNIVPQARGVDHGDIWSESPHQHATPGSGRGNAHTPAAAPAAVADHNAADMFDVAALPAPGADSGTSGGNRAAATPGSGSAGPARRRKSKPGRSSSGRARGDSGKSKVRRCAAAC